MLSVVIPTLDSEATLPTVLAALVGAASQGLVRQVIISDGGSRDATLTIADEMGCEVLRGPPGRGLQLGAGARLASHPWLLFLHSDTVLSAGWEEDAAGFIARNDADGTEAPQAAAFRFALDDTARRARILESIVAMRCALFALPYGDQGLLISRRHYDALGGFGDLPLMEDVDIVRRIGWRRIETLPSRAVTSAERYRRDGYALRVVRNAGCLTLYFLGMSPGRIARIYR